VRLARKKTDRPEIAGDLPKLSGMLKERLIREAGSIVRAAERLNLSDNSLRVWLNRDKYPPAELRGILRFVGMGDDLTELQKQFSFETTNPKREPLFSERERAQSVNSLSGALVLMDERFGQLSRLSQRIGEDIGLLFGSMKKNDLFVFLSLTEIPYEMTATGWAASGGLIERALTEGAHFVYLYPSEDCINTLLRLGQSRIPARVEYQLAADAFVSDVRRSLEQNGNAAKVDLDTQVQMIECPLGSFLSGGHKYVIFKPSDGSPARALAKFPTGSQEQEFAMHLPLEQRTTQDLIKLVLSITARDARYNPITSLLKATRAIDQER
jgi:hypothetical protein